MIKKTLVIGASTNPERYAYKAIKALRKAKHDVVAIGNKSGHVDDVLFETEQIKFDNIDTVTLYINANIQADYEDYIMDLKPKRVIFNPGTENVGFAEKLTKNGIQAEEACTLVLLSIDQY
jgi:uncharacterized protein